MGLLDRIKQSVETSTDDDFDENELNSYNSESVDRFLVEIAMDTDDEDDESYDALQMEAVRCIGECMHEIDRAVLRYKACEMNVAITNVHKIVESGGYDPEDDDEEQKTLVSKFMTEAQEKDSENKKSLIKKIMEAISKAIAYIKNLFSRGMEKLKESIKTYERYANKHEKTDFSKSNGKITVYPYSNAGSVLSDVQKYIGTIVKIASNHSEKFDREGLLKQAYVEGGSEFMKTLQEKAAGSKKEITADKSAASKAISILKDASKSVKMLQSIGKESVNSLKKLQGAAKKAVGDDNAEAKINNVKTAIPVVQSLSNLAVQIVRDRNATQMAILKTAVKSAGGVKKEDLDIHAIVDYNFQPI